MSAYLGSVSCSTTRAIETEILAIILEAIQIAHIKGWYNLWLEMDSSLVFHYFKNHGLANIQSNFFFV